MNRRERRKRAHALRMVARRASKSARQMRRSWDAACLIAPPSSTRVWRNVGTYAAPVLVPVEPGDGILAAVDEYRRQAAGAK